MERKEIDFCNAAMFEAACVPGFLFSGLINYNFCHLYSKSCGEHVSTITSRTDFNLGSLWCLWPHEIAKKGTPSPSAHFSIRQTLTLAIPLRALHNKDLEDNQSHFKLSPLAQILI